MEVLRPSSPEELVDVVQGAATPLELVGSGSKRALGRPVAAKARLDLSAFSAVTIYEPEELVLECGPGTRLVELEALLAGRGQELAFEPPDYSRLLGTNDAGTVGGAIMCNLSGPRRIRVGAARDHVLGAGGVSGAGNAFKAGARVVKNVTGYDLPKLLAGSYGTLAALSSVILKVMPRAETEETVVLEAADDGEAVALMSLAMQSDCEVSGAAYLPGTGVLLRLEGFAASVAYRRDRLARSLAKPVHVRAAQSSAAAWKEVRDVVPLAGAGEGVLWRLSLPPSESPAAVRRLKEACNLRHVLDWAGGLLWLALPPEAGAGVELVRSSFASGHAMLVRAPEAMRAAVEVFQPQPPALAALSGRLKAAFDPRGIFNPGRMYRDL